MENPVMLYKAGGPHDIHGGKFDYVIVEDADVAEKLGEGWHLTTPEALAAGDNEPELDDDAPPTRDELKQKLTALGVVFARNASDEKLTELLAEALAAGGDE